MTATDSGGLTVSDTFTIVVSNINDAPTITSTAVTAINEDVAYNYTLVASDVDAGDAVTFAATTLPSWLSFDAASGVLSGTPTNAQVGSHQIVLTATDRAGLVATQSFAITVTNVNDAPTVAMPIANRSIDQDSFFGFQFGLQVFNDVDVGDRLTYTATLANGGGSYLLGLPSTLRRARSAVRQKMMMLAPFR